VLVPQSPNSLAVPAYAKLNLTLEVLGVLHDGLHDVKTSMQAISLHDLLLVSPAAQTSLEGGFADDLVLRAAKALEAAVGQPLPAHFRLIKRIPAGAGLAGGSSDAATALRLLTRLYGLDLKLCDLLSLATGLGADVPFFLCGGALEATGPGHRLRPIPLAQNWFALAWPGFGVDTGTVYRAWDKVGGDGDNHLTRGAMAVEPKLVRFATRLDTGWRMTGSGTAFFKPCSSPEEAQAAVAALDCWTTVAHPVAQWGHL
jgi:4-diphosphocytidyl-2-C-methyl-D-erythritol kinase